MLLLLVFAGGVAAGVGGGRLFEPAPTHAYRTKIPLPLKDPRGHTIGELPANTLLLSHLRIGKSEHGWWAFAPVLIGDGSDAVAVLRNAEVRKPISSTEMLFVQQSLDTRPTSTSNPQDR